MKKFIAKPLTLLLPESWSEVTLAQFLTLVHPDAPIDSLFIISTLSGLDLPTLRRCKAYDLDVVVMKRIEFIWHKPDVPETNEAPTSIRIGGKTIALPDDLGSDVCLGQMWDVKFLIQSRQNKKLPVTPVTMAESLLSIFLWSRLRDQEYGDHHQAREVWPLIGEINCIEGLKLSAFFLRNSLRPSPSGRISEELISKTRWKSWPQIKRQVWHALTRTSPLSN